MSERTVGEHACDRLMTIGLGLLAVLYVVRLGPRPTYPAFGDDNSVYLVSAQALAEGHGYRLINFPDAPFSSFYPIGYPALLSVLLRFVSLDAVGITLVRLLSVVTCLFFISASYLLLRRYVSSIIALGVTLAIGLSPLVFQMTGEILSECPFAMFVTVAMVLIKKALDEEKQTPPISPIIVAAGLCAGLAMLTRTAGLVFVIAPVLALAVTTRWRKMSTFTLAAGTVVVPWLLWSAAHKTGISSYQAWIAEHYNWQTPFHNARTLAATIMSRSLFPPFESIAAETVLSRVHLSWLVPFLGLVASSIFLIGLISLMKHLDVLAFCITIYLLMVIFYPWEPSRFLMPVLPLLAVPLLQGAKLILRKRQHPGAGKGNAHLGFVCLAVCILGGTSIDLMRIWNVYHYRHWAGQQAAKDWLEMNDALLWMRRNVPPNGVIVSSYPYGTYLFTGRITVAQLPASKINSLISDNASRTPLYVFATERHDFMTNAEFGLTPIHEFMTQNPLRLKPVWMNSDHRKVIYMVTPQ